jgi:hypothetical protein
VEGFLFFVFGNRGWVLRLGAVAYLANAAFALHTSGWHSPFWIGWGAMALGFLALSLGQADSQSNGFDWRSPACALGIAVSLLGAGLLLYSWLR